MFVLKLLLKLLLLPIFLLSMFLSFMIRMASIVSSVFYVLFFLGLLMLIVFIAFQHNWLAVAIGLGIGFIVYLSGFAIVAVNGILMTFNEKFGEFLLS